MSDVVTILDGERAEPPKEIRGLSIQVNFQGGQVTTVEGGSETVQGRLSSTQLSWTNENADKLNAWIAEGGLGAMWGVPLEFQKGGLSIFDGFIDLTKNPQFTCHRVTATLGERKQKDWVSEIADGFDFRYLETKGFIRQSDFTLLPYIVSEIPNYRDALILAISGFMIVNELQRTVKDLINIAANISAVFTTLAGILQLVYFITYLGILITALVKLLNELRLLFIQPIKYHYGMSYFKHWEAACDYLGYKFSSSYFQKNVPTNSVDINGKSIPSGIWADEVWMPIKTKQGRKKNQTPLEKGYYQNTFGDWVRHNQAKFNGKIFIIGDTLHFERKDFADPTVAYTIPDARTDLTGHGINSNEVYRTIFLEFQTDTAEKNTIVNYDGTNVKATAEHQNKGKDGTEILKEIQERRPGCALATRKKTLTEIEKAFYDLFKVIQPIINTIYDIARSIAKGLAKAVKVINKIIKALNKLPKVNIPKINQPKTDFKTPNLAVNITDRIGMLLLSDDITSVPKAVLISGSGYNVKVRKDHRSVLNAENLYNKYHFIDSFVPSTGKPVGNQWYIWEVKNVPFCKDDFDTLRGAGAKGGAVVTTPWGTPAKIDSLNWYFHKDTADIVFWENKTYSENLIEVITKDTGE